MPLSNIIHFNPNLFLGLGSSNPSPTNLPIEQLVEMTMQKISDDSTKDLRGIVDQVDNNMKQKQKVRDLQAQLTRYENSVRSGDSNQASQARQALIDGLQNDLGLDPNSAEVQAATNLPTTLPTDNDGKDKLLNGGVKDMQQLLDGRAQSFSDLGQKLQFELQQANDINNRANKAESDILAKYDQTANAIAQNFKG